jgi:hypothetical protein
LFGSKVVLPSFELRGDGLVIVVDLYLVGQSVGDAL